MKQQEIIPILINRMLNVSIDIILQPIMKVHFHSDHLPTFRNAAITIGTFDGVHSGHRAILEQLKEEARQSDGETVVITFDPHPRRILNSDQAPALLTSMAERIERLEKIGIDHLVIIPFDQAFSEMSAHDYIINFLIRLFSPKIIVIGYDHRFGKGRQGDYVLLAEMAKTHHYEVRQIPQKLLNDAQISSTVIRQALTAGDISKANDLLNYPYQLEGTVIEGDKLGRKLGFPTANLSLTTVEKLVPGSGVYAVRVQLLYDGISRSFQGMMNIGYRPTVNGKERRIEVHIFNFDEEIYGTKIRVSLLAFIRDEMKFANLDELIAQLGKDKTIITEVLKKLMH
ncbi:MAG: bifunctional riboflavin kinase/FAD synthetase [bacterium]